MSSSRAATARQLQAIRARRGCSLAVLSLLLTLGACRTSAPLPPADLGSPDWMVRQGQAVWTAGPGETGVAGELLLARRSDAACYVQFAKPPFTLVTARSDRGGWSLEVPQRRQRRGGRGAGPVDHIWFALAEAIAGRGPGAGWHWEERGAGGWCLQHEATGERLEGYLTP